MKKIAIYGVGKVAKYFYEKHDFSNEELLYFVQTEKEMDLFNNYPVVGISEVDKSVDVLYIANSFADTVFAAINHGISKDAIVLCNEPLCNEYVKRNNGILDIKYNKSFAEEYEIFVAPKMDRKMEYAFQHVRSDSKIIRYTEIDAKDLINKSVFIWGSDKWANWCIKYLAKREIAVKGIIDDNEVKQDQNIEDIVYISQNNECLKQKNVVVVVATPMYSEVFRKDFFKNIAMDHIFYYPSDIYSEFNFNHTGRLYISEEYSVLGINGINELKAYLSDKEIHLYGDQRFIKDFIYVFEGVPELTEFQISEEICPEPQRDAICIVCDRDYDKRCNELESTGWSRGGNIINADDLFCLLDEYGTVGVNVFPQAMLRRTIYATPDHFPSCGSSFRHLSTGGLFSVHPCCSDWSIIWGNLEHNSYEEIWNSSNARIFRLSIINRTFSFCNPNTCVIMKTGARTSEERLKYNPRIKEVPTLEIGIDSSCNLFCASCRRDVYVAKGEKLERIEAVKDSIIRSGWLNKTDRLLLGGNGEVCFSNIYKEIMFSGDVKRNSLDLRTNGTLLDHDFLGKLIEAYNEISIIVSIDAATEDTYRQLRRSHNPKAWAMLNENLQTISSNRKAGNIHFFQINMCTQMCNYMEIPAFIEMGRKLNVDRVYITPIRNWGTYSDNEFRAVSVFDENGNVKKEVSDILSSIDNKDRIVRVVI